MNQNVDTNTGMPLNVVNPPPLGAKSGSPMDVANANMAANNAKMSMLLNVTSGGSSTRTRRGRKHRHSSLYGGAALVVQPLHVPYPGGSDLQNVNTQMTSVGAANVANSQYDNDWKNSAPKQSGGKRSNKRSIKRTIKIKKIRKTGRNKRSNRSRRYKKM